MKTKDETGCCDFKILTNPNPKFGKTQSGAGY